MAWWTVWKLFGWTLLISQKPHTSFRLCCGFVYYAEYIKRKHMHCKLVKVYLYTINNYGHTAELRFAMKLYSVKRSSHNFATTLQETKNQRYVTLDIFVPERFLCLPISCPPSPHSPLQPTIYVFDRPYSYWYSHWLYKTHELELQIGSESINFQHMWDIHIRCADSAILGQ